MSISATISGVPVSVGNASFNIQEPLEDRAVLTFTVLDATGTAVYSRGQPVTFSDPGIISYTGYVQSDQPTKDGLALPYVEHVITCMDGVYNLGKRSNSQNYLNWQAGNIAIDFVRRDLANEGITIAAAMHRDTTKVDFNQGTLSGLVGALHTPDDGDLELAAAGNPVTITEQSTSDFASGTLTNLAAASNSLSPTTVSAIQMVADLPLSLGTNTIEMTVWSGSMTVGTLDTLNYDIWISSSSPAFNAGVDLVFSDGSILSTYTGPIDQNFLPPAPSTDLSSYAKDTWYTRTIALGSALNGKTINSVTVSVAGANAGTYTLFFRNIYLGSQSGSPFFSTSATATQVNPPTVYSSIGYINTLTFLSVVQTIAGTNAQRVSPAHSIDAVKLIGSTFITWNATTPSTSNVQVAVSYDGNAFLACTNNAPLPGLPAGSNVAGISLYLMEIFTPSNVPTTLPTLTSVSVTLTPAPNATKSDIVANYGTSAQWNAGTLFGLAPNANGDLTLGSISRTWSDGLLTNQTFFSSPTGGTISQSASGSKYTITETITTAALFAISRLDFAGLGANFVAEWDMVATAPHFVAVSFFYRVTGGWNNTSAPSGYKVWMQVGNNLIGITSPSALIQSVSHTITSGTSYHFKLNVSGNTHQIYLNGATTPLISVTDSTNLAAGNFGFEVDTQGNTDTNSGSITNLTITPAELGTWQSASNSLAALSTIENSTISWLETLASGAPSSTAIVQTSIDGSTTWTTCTNNGQIPGLVPGTNVSALSLRARIILFSATAAGAPVIGGLNWRVLGAFPSVTGTRTTAPFGNDMSITRTVASGWGTAFDGQSWTQTGTGTTAVGSGEATIANTTGSVHMVLGSTTWGDMEITDRLKISASTLSAGVELRYTDASHYYRLSLSPTGVSIIKNSGAGNVTLQTVAGTYATSTFYRVRFRVVGVCPALLYGKVWPDGTLEPGVNLGYMSTTNPQWTVTASD